MSVGEISLPGGSVPLASPEEYRRQGWAHPPDHGRRLRLLLDAYDLPAEQRHGFSARVTARMEITASGIESLATRGEPAFQGLIHSGVPDRIRRDRAWVEARIGELDAATALLMRLDGVAGSRSG
jgi:hypothetical protein